MYIHRPDDEDIDMKIMDAVKARMPVAEDDDDADVAAAAGGKSAK